MKTYPFSALFSRMKYITRWSLMRSTRAESLSEHTADTAMLAHTLCLIGKSCTGTGAALRPEVVATAALYHDAPEILTGDMPTPVKYYSPHIREAYAQVEQSACEHLASMLPEDLRADFAPIFFKDESDEDLSKLVKAADKICAYIKCIDEKKAGNTEFDRAAESTLESINALDIPEAEEFMKEFLDGYRLTLDEIKE